MIRVGNDVYLRARTAPTIFDDGKEGITIIIEDISEHMKLEFAVKESEEKYRNVVETQTEFICRFRPDGTHVFVNEAYCRYFGKKCSELIGKKFKPEIPKADKAKVREHFASLTQDHPVLTVEHRIIMPDGDIRWQQWVDRAIFDKSGTIVEYQTTGRDITDHIRTESELRESESRFNHVAENAGEWIWEVDKEGLYRYCSPAVERILGYTPGELVSRKHYFELFAPEVREELTKISLAVFERQEPFRHFVNPNVHKNGSTVILETSGSPVQDESGALLGYCGIDMDITERRRTELALEEREKLYRSVIENIQDVFYRSDKDGNLIMASPSWASMLGYDSLDECIGHNIADEFWWEPALRNNFLKAVHKKGFVRDYEVVLKRRDGTPVYVSTNSHLYYDESGAILGVEGIFRDISERHAATEKIQRSVFNAEFLSRKLLEFIELSPESDIYAKIGADLKSLVPHAMIVVNSYNSSTGILTTHSLLGETDLDKCAQCLGRSPLGLKLPIDAVTLNQLRTSRLSHLPLPLFEVVSRKIPRDICEKITESVNIGDIYAIGFSKSGELLGNAVICLYKGTGIKDTRLIETYAHQASIALQRRIAEEALKHAQEVFSEIIGLAALPISIIDPNGKYLYINKSFSLLFGYKLRDFQTGRGWFLLAYPDPAYRNQVIAAWKSDLGKPKGGKPQPRTFTVRCKDGTDKEINFRLITLSDGKQCIVYEDITGRVQSDRVKTLLSAIIESADVAIIGKTIDGTIISWNPAAERIYGYSQDEMIGKHISQITPPEKRQEMHAILEKIRNRETVKSLETLRVRKDGTVVEIALTVSPIFDADGNVAGASSIAWDISLRKAEEHLKESEEKYRAVVENIAVGVYRSTGDPKGRFTWGNPALLKILGYSSLETLGEVDVAHIFVEPDGRKTLLEELARTGFVKNRELALVKSDGTKITVLVTALAKINHDGGIEYISGLVEDITGRRETEHELQDIKKEILEVIEFLPDPTFIIDREKKVVAWNSAVELLTGVKKADILGKSGQTQTPASPFYGDKRPILIDMIDAPEQEIAKYYGNVKRDGETLEAEVFAPLFKQGTGAFLWAKAAPLTDSAGNRIGAIETIRDISAIRSLMADSGKEVVASGSSPGQVAPVSSRAISPASQAHVPPMLSLLYLSNALKLAHDAITILDTSARCVWVNDALLMMLGAGKSEAIVGKSVVDFIITEHREAVLDHLMTLHHSGPVSLPLSVITSTGNLPVDTSISGVSDEHGELLGYMLIMRNTKHRIPGTDIIRD